jgi:hypothetical protein
MVSYFKQSEDSGFFQNCYHLKDWMKNDPTIESLILNDFVERNNWLTTCGIICNITKHLNATKNFTVNHPKSSKKTKLLPNLPKIDRDHPIQEIKFDLVDRWGALQSC